MRQLRRVFASNHSALVSQPGFAQLSGEADPAHYLQQVISEVDLPPAQALTAAMHKFMVIVVPTFAESDECQKKVIAALIVGFKAPGSPDVGNRVDRKSAMKQEHR